MASLFVDDTVLSATVVIFSRKGCPYSWRARLLLEEIDMEPKMVELETLGGNYNHLDLSRGKILMIDFGEEVERILRRITGQVSVPYIFAQGNPPLLSLFY